MEGAKLVVTKLTDGDFLRKLENAIPVGKTLSMHKLLLSIKFIVVVTFLYILLRI